jgi:hypothetical protein
MSATVFEQIKSEHNSYIKRLHDAVADVDKTKQVTNEDRVDRVAFHVIEEIIEMRRTYPHKFWKHEKETFNKEALVEEAADVFLMLRSMYMEICDLCSITEEQFLQKVLDKVRKNMNRLKT